MNWRQGGLGRVFVLRLGDGDRLPDCVEAFAAEQGLSSGLCFFLGGLGGDKMVVGPEDGKDLPPVPMLHTLIGAHEAQAVGTLFPDEDGRARLHMHASVCRSAESYTGCLRPGVDVWLVGECVVVEMTGLDLGRKLDQKTGFELLEIEGP